MKNKSALLLFASILFTFYSCVSSKQYKDLKTREESCQKTNTELKEANRKLETKLNELGAELDRVKADKSHLLSDSLKNADRYSNLKKELDNLKSDYNELIENHAKMQAGSNEESRKLVSDLQKTQENLQDKEEKLKNLEYALNKKQADLERSNSELKKRENRVKELESILARKDSAVNALRNAVSEALLGFKDKGLSVEVRNGKVYVSLEERLLFASGSTDIDKKGVEALKQLAKVLEKDADINVMIEGHTDDVPIAGGAIKDNWDLSVLRATSVLKTLSSGSKIDPKRLIAAGRGEFLPIDNAKTPEARKKNRRTEIILTPKLDELFKVLENK